MAPGDVAQMELSSLGAPSASSSSLVNEISMGVGAALCMHRGLILISRTHVKMPGMLVTTVLGKQKDLWDLSAHWTASLA